MAYGIVLEFAGVTPLGADGRIVAEVWDSKAAPEAWITGRLGPVLASVGVPAPARVTETELVSYVTP